MRFLRILTKIAIVLTVLLVVLIACTITTTDDTPVTKTEAYATTKKNLAQLTKLTYDTTKVTVLRVGWAKASIVPAKPTPTAGYGVRKGKNFTGIRDSLFVRAMVFDDGNKQVAILSADLLIVPPNVVSALNELLKASGFPPENIYFGACHSHNSIGGWGNGLGGEQFAGAFNPETINFLAKQMHQAIIDAKADLAPAEIGYGQVYLADMVYNRLVGNEGTIDAFVRMLKVKKANGQTGLILTYAAHATIISHENLKLSRDYTGILTDSLERQSVNFAMFMAGAVGSMGPLTQDGKPEEENLRNQALGIQLEVQRVLPSIKTQATQKLGIQTLPLALRPPQFLVAKGWKLRQWGWDLLFGEAKADIKALRIGETLWLGMPGDFSGELVPELPQKQLIITSFNGNYIGYILPNKYDTRDSYESTTMNWYGPQTGGYVVETAKGLLEKM